MLFSRHWRRWVVFLILVVYFLKYFCMINQFISELLDVALHYALITLPESWLLNEVDITQLNNRWDYLINQWDKFLRTFRNTYQRYQVTRLNKVFWTVSKVTQCIKFTHEHFTLWKFLISSFHRRSIFQHIAYWFVHPIPIWDSITIVLVYWRVKVFAHVVTVVQGLT